MAEFSMPWDSTGAEIENGEGKFYTSDEWCLYFSQFVSSGVVPQYRFVSADSVISERIGSSLMVLPGEGLGLVISEGSAIINGRLYHNSEPLALMIETTSTASVWDVILHEDRFLRSVYLSVRRRSAGVSKQNVLMRNQAYYELLLATINMPANAVKVLDTYIQDTRLDTSLSAADEKPICGFTSGLFEADTASVYTAYMNSMTENQAAFSAWMGNTAGSWDTWFNAVKLQMQNFILGILPQATDSSFGVIKLGTAADGTVTDLDNNGRLQIGMGGLDGKTANGIINFAETNDLVTALNFLNLKIEAAQPHGEAEFLVNANFIVPSGVTEIQIYGCSGGGGGGSWGTSQSSNNTQSKGGNGGGAGANGGKVSGYASRQGGNNAGGGPGAFFPPSAPYIMAVTPWQIIPVVVGISGYAGGLTAGSPANAGGNGTISSVGDMQFSNAFGATVLPGNDGNASTNYYGGRKSIPEIPDYGYGGAAGVSVPAEAGGSGYVRIIW